MVEISPITSPEPVLDLFIRSNLEIAEDEFAEKEFLSGYQAKTQDGRIVGGCVLVLQKDHYVINGIAVEPEYRKENLASKMLSLCLEDAKKRGAKEVILVARAPGFFRKQGFLNVADGDVPEGLFDCLVCPQYKTECFPEIMKLRL